MGSVEAVDEERARTHPQAVFVALREGVTYRSSADVLDQLGPEYVELLG